MAATTQGSLDRYPLPRLLCFLHKKRFEGVLRLELRPEAREVRLLEGVPVSVSPDPHLDLLQLFVDRGRLSQEAVPALADALGLPYADPEALLGAEAGLSPEEVRRGQRYALFQSLVSLFRERDAAFSLTAGETRSGRANEASNGVTGAVEPLYLVYHGLAATYDEARLLAELGPVANQAIQAKAGAEELLAPCGLTEAEARPLQYLRRGYWLLDDLLAALPDQRVPALRVVYLLVSAEALDIAPPDSVPRLRPKRAEEPAVATHTEGPSSAARWQVQSPAEAKRAEPSPAECIHKPAPLTEAGGVPPATPPPLPAAQGGGTGRARATGAEAAKATPPPQPSSGARAVERSGVPETPQPTPTPSSGERAVRARPAPTTSGLFARARVAPKVLREAREKAVQARQDLSDRPDSLEMLEELLRRLEEMEGQNPFELLGVKLDATTLEVKKAYMGLVKRLHPDRLTSLGLGALSEAADSLFKRLSEANQALSNDEQIAEARRIYQEAASGQDPEAAMRAIEAEVSFQKGEVFFRKGDLAQAETYFQQAVEGNPEEGEHLAMLAWTRYQSIARELRGEHRDGILKMLTQAVALSPRCARAHYFAGKLHQEEHRVERALESFRLASKLKRGYIEAEREIRLIEMRQRAGKPSTTKGSIFDVFKRGKK